ncbi:SRPBCC domain-containing protein [Streptomyces albiaxialis]|uniref:SRPBCC domain-containing protein n=1 Tax=Streptomyces albiaxialis TaxID=329523 RepID=A0ABN2W5X7_9ACTN
MEHEVYVPFPIGSVRAALADRERVARCVPGLQQDAEGGAASGAESGTEGAGAPDPGTVAGRMRVRIGGSTITYRGSLTLTPREAAGGVADGFSVEGTGSEARGSGSVKLVLSVVPRPAESPETEGEEGSHLLCTGTVTGTGRIGDADAKAAASAGIRLLDRFGAALTDSLRDDPPPVTGGIGAPGDNERAIPGIPEPEERAEPEGRSGERSGERPGETEHASVFETEIPPSSLEAEDAAGTGTGDGPGRDPLDPEDPLAAEAAHARRTMIGRSAEEVDHAPPRGRYAPVPAPEPATATATLRWAAPAAAVVVAGAVVIGRVLRRRR